jgi:hypothetical protein
LKERNRGQREREKKIKRLKKERNESKNRLLKFNVAFE